MHYCKLINGRIQYAPKKITLNGSTVYNPTAEMLIADGWKPLTVEPQPTPLEEGYHLEATYSETEEAIVQSWIVVEDPPMELTTEERIALLEEQLEAAKILLGVE